MPLYSWSYWSRSLSSVRTWSSRFSAAIWRSCSARARFASAICCDVSSLSAALACVRSSSASMVVICWRASFIDWLLRRTVSSCFAFCCISCCRSPSMLRILRRRSSRRRVCSRSVSATLALSASTKRSAASCEILSPWTGMPTRLAMSRTARSRELTARSMFSSRALSRPMFSFSRIISSPNCASSVSAARLRRSRSPCELLAASRRWRCSLSIVTSSCSVSVNMRMFLSSSSSTALSDATWRFSFFLWPSSLICSSLRSISAICAESSSRPRWSWSASVLLSRMRRLPSSILSLSSCALPRCTFRLASSARSSRSWLLLSSLSVPISLIAWVYRVAAKMSSNFFLTVVESPSGQSDSSWWQKMTFSSTALDTPSCVLISTLMSAQRLLSETVRSPLSIAMLLSSVLNVRRPVASVVSDMARMSTGRWPPRLVNCSLTTARISVASRSRGSCRKPSPLAPGGSEPVVA
eukprot:Unigene10584_Nuclearia_a/m.32362 Unigene10584_Nuclearia_a/g.32362  ORF Unigene10584_Nuclearia_a/g.32362 Unigene10584_Nuclearia_a/m.32362 type:complete len:469 (+) Unigene10584_Nuclearia_a:2029-3435(+)